jgi:hypothetical protein
MSRRLILAGPVERTHVKRIRRMRRRKEDKKKKMVAYGISVGNFEGIRSSGKHRRKWKGNISLNLQIFDTVIWSKCIHLSTPGSLIVFL